MRDGMAEHVMSNHSNARTRTMNQPKKRMTKTTQLSNEENSVAKTVQRKPNKPKTRCKKSSSTTKALALANFMMK